MLLSLLLSPLAVVHALAPPADSVPSIAEQEQRDHIRPAAKRLSEEEEAYSSEDSPEDFLIREPSQALRETFGLTPFYQQWLDVEGYPVVASENVNPYAVKEAAWLIRQLMSHRPDVLQAMVQNKASHSVMAYNEMITQIPEHSHLRPDFYWDIRARGLGGPLESSSGEENLLNYPGDPYDGYHVMIHEFSHSVHLDGLNTADPGFDDRLRKAFDAAIAKGLWKGTYASSNRREYWAEGAQAWFHAQFEHIDIDTRAELKEYDPELAKLLTEVFGDTDWRYTPPATRTHLPHLQGFDPQDSPTFEWPPELAACYQQLREPDGDGGDKWINLEPYDLSQLSRLRSPTNKTGETEIIFVNESGATISYYWIDFNGTEIYFGYLAFGEVAVFAFVGHIWLIKDQHGNDLAVFRAEEKTGRVFIGGETEALADSEPSSEDQQGSEEQPTTAVELEGISTSHDSIRENDEQATVITLTVTLDRAAATDETITLAIISPTQGKTAKHNEDFDATLDETLTIAKGQKTGTAQLTLTPKDNTTAEGDKAFAVQATSSSGHAALINIKIIDNDAAVEQTPHSLTKVSGEGQQGPANTQLAEPFVVSVLDQDDAPLAGVDVTFAVTAGEGLLADTTDADPCTIETSTSSITSTTDANGQAATRLTLGSQPGTNTVSKPPWRGSNR